MVINTTISTPSGNARRFTLASSAPFGALACRLLALPSSILTHCGSANSGLGFGAADLSPGQASRLAAVLPSPLKWSAEDPGPYVLRRSGRIDARQGTVLADGLADCVLR